MAVGGASDEALHEEQVSVVEACMGKPVLRGVHVEPRCAVLVMRAHELEGVEPLGLEPKVMAMAPKDGNRQAFAQSGEFVVWSGHWPRGAGRCRRAGRPSDSGAL